MWLLVFFIVFWRAFKLRSSNFLNVQLMRLGKAELCFLEAFEPSSSTQVEVLLSILGDSGIKDMWHEVNILSDCYGPVFLVSTEHDTRFCLK